MKDQFWRCFNDSSNTQQHGRLQLSSILRNLSSPISTKTHGFGKKHVPERVEAIARNFCHARDMPGRIISRGWFGHLSDFATSQTRDFFSKDWRNIFKFYWRE